MRWMLAIGALLVVSHVSATVAPARSSELAFDRRALLETQVQRAVNEVRAARGLPTLRVTAGLRNAAAAHSRSMLAQGFFAHDSLDGTPFHHRIRKHYPSRGWEVWTVGETLLASGGTTDARSIVAAWLRSPGHREVVLSAAWREVGIGAFFRADPPGRFDGLATLVVTADFGYRAGKQDAQSVRR